MILHLIFNNGPKNTCLSTVEIVEPLGSCWAKVQGDIFYFLSFQRCGSLSPLAAVILGVLGMTYFAIFLSCAKNSLSTDQKMFKNWSLHPWKTLSALPSSCWIFTGCGKWRSWGQSLLVQSTPQGLEFDFCGWKDLPPHDSWVFQAGWDPPVQKEMGSTDITPWTLRHQQFPQIGQTWSPQEKGRAHLSTLKEKWSPGGSVEVSFSWHCNIPQDCCLP